MTENFRKTLRSFLRGEKPTDRAAALDLVNEWFGRYQPDPGLLAEEVDRYFAAQESDGDGGSARDRILSAVS